MSLTLFIHSGVTPTGVQFVVNNFHTTALSGTVYSGVKFGADGNIYERQSGGGWSSVGSWLLSGVNSDFYIVRTIDTGTLTTDGGAGPLVLSSDRIYDIQQSIVGTNTATISFIIENVATTDLASTTYSFRAIRDM